MLRELFATLLVSSALVVLVLYIVINGYYLLIHVLSLFQLRDEYRTRQSDPAYGTYESPFLPGIAVIVPAYNEEATIVDSVRSLLDQSYPERSVIVVNDGSEDATLDRLREAYDLEKIHDRAPWDLPCEQVHGVYHSVSVDDLLVIDKENGGKSDALNAGIGLTEQPLFCSIDADSLIDRDGLWHVVRPFLAHPSETVASGGVVRVANDCEIEGGQVLEANVSERSLIGLQEIEYLRAFYSGRLGLDRLRSLLVISGTFGLFETEAVREIDGYATDIVTEDLDLVVRLHRQMLENDRPYRVEFVPEPVVWTQVPETLADLSTQRRRWYRGLLEVFARNRDMIGNPNYGVVGTVAMPLYLLSEGIGPLIETYGYVVVPVAFALGMVNLEFFAFFLLVIVGFGVFLSWFGVFSEVWSYRRYDDPREIAILLGNAVIENVGYRQWKAFVSTRGFLEFLRNDTSWGAIERQSFSDETAEPNPNVEPDVDADIDVEG
ncbi:glycosyl transferase family 2 [Halalkaliarchaeum desulfuricum]|uniref:Glycosyl transferase family 2 n=1 Tax=Halalkaliarchaeum desulfuricum TaxID=2055893 RepID=A0A343TG68_9EURY|nr:glycosyltransferase family 2 protein [Halalkaliarchaeum desulfuricum]AUX08090.1 glycosyl transferase family 2 [Halalkaliarchaeum desulfuricum]